jgi:hypothetical protein
LAIKRRIKMIEEMVKPSLRVVLTNEFGDKTDITIDLAVCDMEHVYESVQDALRGCGFADKTVKEFFEHTIDL